MYALKSECLGCRVVKSRQKGEGNLSLWWQHYGLRWPLLTLVPASCLAQDCVKLSLTVAVSQRNHKRSLNCQLHPSFPRLAS